MALLNISKPSTSFANATRINIGEVWSTASSTWANESRTWGDMVSLIDNISRVTSSFSNVSKPI